MSEQSVTIKIGTTEVDIGVRVPEEWSSPDDAAVIAALQEEVARLVADREDEAREDLVRRMKGMSSTLTRIRRKADDATGIGMNEDRAEFSRAAGAEGAADLLIAKLAGAQGLILEAVCQRQRAEAESELLRLSLRRYVLAQSRMLERWSEGDSTVKERLWRELHACEEEARKLLQPPVGDCWQVLGIDPTADKDELRSAWNRRLQELVERGADRSDHERLNRAMEEAWKASNDL